MHTYRQEEEPGRQVGQINLSFKMKSNQMSDIYSVLCCFVCVNRRSWVTQMFKSLGQVVKPMFSCFLFLFRIVNVVGELRQLRYDFQFFGIQVGEKE